MVGVEFSFLDHFYVLVIGNVPVWHYWQPWVAGKTEFLAFFWVSSWTYLHWQKNINWLKHMLSTDLKYLEIVGLEYLLGFLKGRFCHWTYVVDHILKWFFTGSNIAALYFKQPFSSHLWKGNCMWLLKWLNFVAGAFTVPLWSRNMLQIKEMCDHVQTELR